MSKETNKTPGRKGPMAHNNMMVTEKAKNFKGSLKKLWDNLKDYKIIIIIILILTIGSTVFSIVGPKILGDATTLVFEGLMSKIQGGTGINFSEIGKILMWLSGLYILSALLAYAQGILMARVSNGFTFKLRKRISEKINKLPMSYFDKKTHGEVLSVITNDVDTISQALTQSAVQIISSVATIIGIIIMMFTIDVIMTIVTLAVLPVSMLLLGKIFKKSQIHFKNQQDYLGHVNGGIEEMYSGHSIVKVFNAEDKMIGKFKKDNDMLYTSGWKSQFLSGLMFPIMNFISNISYALVAIVGGFLVIAEKITVGAIQSFIQYSRNFTQTIGQLAQVSSSIQSMIASSERVFEFLEENEMPINKKTIKNTNIKGAVEFKSVKFGYLENQTIVNDFSAKIKEGQKIAIVGPTGAGKTTMVKLLMRFYNVNEGAILVDGVNISDFDKDTYRHAFGMVLQDTWLFNDTIMENLRYGRLGATDDEVIEAAKAAHVHHFIQTLPEGYKMVINEETNNISGGQKQLLTIARAILADPKVLILDEATSSVDTRTETLIQKAMDELMKGRTSFVIAHRLSTIKDADLILVMDKGDIVEQGNHEELLKKKGFYAKLYNSQFEKISI